MKTTTNNQKKSDRGPEALRAVTNWFTVKGHQGQSVRVYVPNKEEESE